MLFAEDTALEQVLAVLQQRKTWIYVIISVTNPHADLSFLEVYKHQSQDWFEVWMKRRRTKDRSVWFVFEAEKLGCIEKEEPPLGRISQEGLVEGRLRCGLQM